MRPETSWFNHVPKSHLCIWLHLRIRPWRNKVLWNILEPSHNTPYGSEEKSATLLRSRLNICDLAEVGGLKPEKKVADKLPSDPTETSLLSSLWGSQTSLEQIERNNSLLAKERFITCKRMLSIRSRAVSNKFLNSHHVDLEGTDLDDNT